jgi:hypothetical protein
MKILVPSLVAVAVAAVAVVPASAQTLYKLIDKNGKVTYSETPPKNFDGKVIRMDIDPNANTATLPKPGAGPSTGGEGASKDAETIRRGTQAQQKKSREEDRLERARARVEEAKARLQDLIDNPGDNDVQRMGKVGGGTRPVLTAEYQERIKQAEAQVKAAEEELERVQSGR